LIIVIIRELIDSEEIFSKYLKELKKLSKDYSINIK